MYPPPSDVPLKWADSGKFWELTYRLLSGSGESDCPARGGLRQALDRLQPEGVIQERAARPLRESLTANCNRHLRAYLQLYRVALKGRNQSPEAVKRLVGLDITLSTLANEVLQILLDAREFSCFFSSPFAAAIAGTPNLGPLYDEPAQASLKDAAALLALKDSAVLRGMYPGFLPYDANCVPLSVEAEKLFCAVIEVRKRHGVSCLRKLAQERLQVARILYQQSLPEQFPEELRSTWAKIGVYLSKQCIDHLETLVAESLVNEDFGNAFCPPGGNRPVRHCMEIGEVRRVLVAYRRELLELLAFEHFAVKTDAWRDVVNRLATAIGDLQEEIEHTARDVHNVPVENAEFSNPRARELGQLVADCLGTPLLSTENCGRMVEDLQFIACEIEQGRVNKDLDISRRVYSTSVVPLDDLLFDSAARNHIDEKMLGELRCLRQRLLAIMERGGYHELGDEQLLGRRVSELPSRDWIDMTSENDRRSARSELTIVEVRRPGYWLPETNQIVKRALVRF